MEFVITILKDFGFPVACVFGLAWYIKYKDDKTAAEFKEQRETHSNEMREQRESHEREVTKLKDTLDNNTKVIQELLFYLKGSGNNG